MHILILILMSILIVQCSQPNEIMYNQLQAIPYYKEEMKDGVKIKTRLRHKMYVYHYDGKPYTGLVKNFHPNKEIESEGYMKNGFQNGIWTYYYDNGRTVKMKGNFKDGVADSTWRKYFKDKAPKVVEFYTLKNDTLICDTIAAWYNNNNKMIETSKDTVRVYFRNGKLHRQSIGKPQIKFEEVFEKNGVLLSRTKNYKKEVFLKGKVVRTIYNLKTEEARKLFFKEGYKWSDEEIKDINRADSLEFNFTNAYDPVVKIYWP